MKIKKIIATLCLIVMLSVTVLSGCSLIERNNKAYMNQVVAKMGTVKVRMYELQDGFNQFGYQYLENDMTAKQAVRQTAKDLIDKKLLLKFYKQQEAYYETNPVKDPADPSKVHPEADKRNPYKLTQNELNTIKKQVYDAMNYQLADFEYEVMLDWNITPPESDVQENEEGNADFVYQPYEPRIVFNATAGKWEIKEEQEEEVLEDLGAFAFVSTSTDAVFTEAKSRLHKLLRDDAKARGKKKMSDQNLINDKVSELLKNYTDNFKINKLSSIFEDNQITEDAITDTNTRITAKFRELYEKEEFTYKNNINLGPDDLGNIFYYMPQSAQGKFFNVSHILLPFNEADNAQLEKVKSQIGSKYTREDYNTIRKNLAGGIALKPRDGKGVETGKAKTAKEILEEVQHAVAVAGSFEKQAEAFNALVYKYNSDPGIMNKERDYIIPIAKEKVKDTMVEAFADAAREIRSCGTWGWMENDYVYDNEKTRAPVLVSQSKGAVSGLVETDYGYHIIFYSGELTGVISGTPTSNDHALLATLYEKLTKAGHNKTYYHKIYEEVLQADFNTYADNLITTLQKQNGKKITLYNSAMKSLWKKQG